MKLFRISQIGSKAFTLVEILVSVAILGLILLVITSFILWMNYSYSKTRSDNQAIDNATRAMETMTYEIKGSESVYAPTVTSSQLSLKTARYTLTGHTQTYLDFFLCGTALCMKKESQNLVAITSDLVEVSNFQITRVANGGTDSVKINLTVDGVTLNSTVSLRKYE